MSHLFRASWLAVALALPCAAFSGASMAGTTVPRQAIAGDDLLAKFMADARPARAQFIQKDDQGVARGEVVVGTQGKLRWSQNAPYQSLLVSNGKTAWQVDPDLMQATRLDAKMTEGWAGVFGNRQALERTYSIEQTGQRITLVPKRKDGIKGTIDFDAAGNPAVVRFGAGPTDRRADASTEIRFTQWTRLASEPKDLFDYHPGKGMDVIGGD